ncbi:PREDICTED: putative polypeptide N-acetylgalactosaminyltransferase 13 [Drosophila arizonae]|uniref:Polypeptide N-acetylgalactosaminyltransferase n=1 Tax=Drosophila arizonae TaxID=7263 RepID=A0ABM1PDZ2_DROAR|nr:PREDICTED: putative polypeptide N-acetylgalactosaminyltransferase 13 [Drosophila arizonae]
MSGRLHRRLRCCLLGVLTVLAMQLLIVVLVVRFGLIDELISHRLLLQQQQLNLHQLEWREFITHTPDQPHALHQYNRQLSDNLAAVRLLPTTRHHSCNRRRYRLPQASQAKLSVVICFHNEARSMLLRTILTLISRTPEEYLHELIVIDDGSEDAGLLASLERHMTAANAQRGRPTLIFRRNLGRKGLIWSRNEGARLASGHYLLFLDSHCEVNDGWLEPLLERLALNSRVAVSPVLDPIEPETLSYMTGNALLKGGFDWSLHFHWLPRVLAEKEALAQPYASPAFAGGILMISRESFHKLHGFNPHLEIWGGESIELAIKLWLCGGQIEIVPCSRIGHIFRPAHAFEFPLQFEQEQKQKQEKELEQELDGEQLDSAQATYLRNSKIIAESWLDEYKYLFYALKPSARQIPLNLRPVSQPSYDPAQIKAELKCRPFDWLMRHVSPELRLHHANLSALGSLRNADRCLHVAGTEPQLQLQLASCHGLQVTQWHLHQESGQLSTSEQGLCLAVDAAAKQPQLSLEPCRAGQGRQHWLRRNTQLQHAGTHLCLDNPLKDQLLLSHCRPHAVSQSFQFALEMEAQS